MTTASPGDRRWPIVWGREDRQRWSTSDPGPDRDDQQKAPVEEWTGEAGSWTSGS
jgi:hypothetical protein